MNGGDTVIMVTCVPALSSCWMVICPTFVPKTIKSDKFDIIRSESQKKINFLPYKTKQDH